MQSSTIEAALIPCTSTSRGLNRSWFSSWRKILKCIHAHSVGNCPVENGKFGPKTTIGRIFLSPYFTNKATATRCETCLGWLSDLANIVSHIHAIYSIQPRTHPPTLLICFQVLQWLTDLDLQSVQQKKGTLQASPRKMIKKKGMILYLNKINYSSSNGRNFSYDSRTPHQPHYDEN